MQILRVLKICASGISKGNFFFFFFEIFHVGRLAKKENAKRTRLLSSFPLPVQKFRLPFFWRIRRIVKRGGEGREIPVFSFTGEDLTGHIMAGFSFKSLGLRTVENVVPRDYLAMFFEISGGKRVRNSKSTATKAVYLLPRCRVYFRFVLFSAILLLETLFVRAHGRNIINSRRHVVVEIVTR